MKSLNIFIPLLFLLVPLFGLMFVVRILLGPFSPKIWSQMRKYPALHVIWGLFTILSFYFIFVFIPTGPPDWVDRIGQRKKLQERVNNAGGWDLVRQGCIQLVESKPESHFNWLPPATNVTVYPDPQTNPHYSYKTNLDYGPLPPAVAILKPRRIEYYSGVMSIQLFGMHSTGGHSTPYFGLEILCDTNISDYRPDKERNGAGGSRNSKYRQVAEGIFEKY